MTENVGWDFRTDEKFERGCTTHHVGLHRVCVDCIFGSPNMDFFEILNVSVIDQFLQKQCLEFQLLQLGQISYDHLPFHQAQQGVKNQEL